MMRRRRVMAACALSAALPVALAAAQSTAPTHGHGTPGAAPAAPQITLLFASAQPGDLSVLAGDEVRWLNGSLRKHTVTSRDGLFDSGPFSTGRTFSYTFPATGRFAYYCRIHPFVNGVIEVGSILLGAPDHALLKGERFRLSGRTLPGAREVALEADTSSGFAQAATTTVATDGSFQFEQVANGPASYRAVAADRVSAPVKVAVSDRRTLVLAARRAGKASRLTVGVAPPAPGSTLVLQLRLRERFGWWPVRQVTLSAAGRRSFTYAGHPGAAARAVLVGADGASVGAVSNQVHLPRR